MQPLRIRFEHAASHQPALSAADVPETLRQPLEGALGAGELIERAVYSPAFKTSRFRFPASVVALTADRWLMAWEDEGAVETEADHIEDLLSLELTCILLYGQLNVDSVKDGQYQASAVQFNTVAEHRYSELIRLALTRLAGSAGEGSFLQENGERLRDYPLKFRNAGVLYLPPGERVLQSVCWDRLFGGFRRELVPATEVIRTERYLVIIAEEKTRGWFVKKETPYGEIIRYIPQRHLGKVAWEGGSRTGRALLEVRNAHGCETLEIDAPLDKSESLTALLGVEAPPQSEATAETA
jgi:hypothetical protein